MTRIRSQGEIEAAVCDAVSRFQQDFMGRGPKHVHAHLVENRLFVHLEGVLTAAEQRLLEGSGAGNGKGAELLKQLRSQLVIAGRQVLDKLVCGVAGRVAFVPAVPGLAPGAFMRARPQREGMPVPSSRPRKRAQAGCRSEACAE